MLCREVKVRTENTDFLRAAPNPVGNPVVPGIYTGAVHALV